MSVTCSLCSESIDDGQEEFRGHYSAAHLYYFPFACAYCKIWFASKGKLQRHHSNAHDGQTLRLNYDPNDDMEILLNSAVKAEYWKHNGSTSGPWTKQAPNACGDFAVQQGVSKMNVTMSSRSVKNEANKQEARSNTIKNSPTKPIPKETTTSAIETIETNSNWTAGDYENDSEDDDPAIVFRPLFHCDWKNCTKAYRKSHLLMEHWQNKHIGLKRYRCGYCGTALTKKCNLRRHVKFFHRLEVNANGESNRTDGSPSQTETSEASGLRQKANDASEMVKNRPMCDCPNCLLKPDPCRITRRRKKRFQPETYKRNRPPLPVHICRTCGKTYKIAANLREHIRLHTGEKPFECEIDACEKRFARQHSFLRHRNVVHKKLMPYVCCKCDRQFGVRENFSKHAMAHLVERQRSNIFATITLPSVTESLL